MSKSNIFTVPQEELPTCRVCEAPSTGIHYGVISCEACKEQCVCVQSFFRRNALKADQFECAEDRRCDVSHKSRTCCPYCRIQKCFQAGMSRDASKTGRRTCKINSSILKTKENDESKNSQLYSSEVQNGQVKPVLAYQYLEHSTNSGLKNITDSSRVNIENGAYSSLQSSSFNVPVSSGINNGSIGRPFQKPLEHFTNSGLENVAVSNTENIVNDVFSSLQRCSVNVLTSGRINSSTSLSSYDESEEMMEPVKDLSFSNPVIDGLVNMLSSASINDDGVDENVISGHPIVNNAPGFDTPGFDTPGFDASGFGTPGFGAPGFDAPGFDAPGFDAPGFGEPGFDIVEYLLGPQQDNSNDKLEDLNYNEEFSLSSSPRCSSLFYPSKSEIYDSVIERMVVNNREFAGGEVNIKNGLSETELKFSEMINLKKKLFGTLQPLPAEDYAKFYKETGLDIDGRRDMILEMIPALRNAIKNGASFVRTIPGYTKLCLEDQIELMKHKFLEFYMISVHRCYNIEHKLFSPFPGKVFHLDDMIRLEGERALSTYELHYKLNKLNLTEQEIVVLAALTVMNTDECSLIDGGAVERSQDFLLECLFYLFSKHDSESLRRFARVVSCLTELKNLCHGYVESQANFFLQWIDVDLVSTVFSTLNNT